MTTPNTMQREQIIGAVQYGALRNPNLNHVLQKFGAIAFKRCSVMMEFEAFLQRVLAERVPNHRDMVCLEIGTFQGISAIVLAQYFKRVICVSVDVEPHLLIKREIVDSLGLKNLLFFDVRNNAEKQQLVQTLSFDFAYQDGNHIDDTHEDWELLRPCGRVLLHEYWPIQPPVWNLVNALPQHEVMRAQYDCLAYWQSAALS